MKIIKINEEHYIVVDDSQIKEGDWCLMFDDYGNLFLGNQPQQYLGEQAGHHLNKGLKKITHSTQPLAPIKELIEKGYDNILPLDIDEIKELIGEVDVKEESSNFNERHWQKYWENTLKKESCATNGKRDVYIAGYNQAIEDNKEKKYTEEDMRNAIKMGRDIIDFDQGMIPWYKFKFVDIIQSLQPKTEWEVEIVDGKLKLK